MYKKINDLTGNRYGKLVVLGLAKERIRGRVTWTCKCDCGNTIDIIGVYLTKAKGTKSCGCICRKHGMFGTRIYNLWHTMKERCYVPTSTSYPNYGARGIRVCSEWQEFVLFMEWAYANGYDENAPRGQCTLDRIDPNGNYEPNNCRWVNASVQANNTRSNVYLEYNGINDTLSNHARRYGINPVLAEGRYLRGLPLSSVFHNGNLVKPKKVLQYDKNMNLIKVWNSCKELCKETNYNESNIRGCLSGHRKSSYGYIWRYE